MTKPYLSIIAPFIPGRIQRLKAMITRLSLSGSLYPDIPFEFVIVDGGSTDDTKALVEKASEFIPIKYIWVPINGFVNANYPRNIALRVSEGQIIGHLDADHWASEHIIKGMCQPFLDGVKNIINRGYVIDSSKSEFYQTGGVDFLENLNALLLSQKGLDKVILDVFKNAKIPSPGVNNTLWIWSARRKEIMSMNGYDEVYCQAYGRDEDDFRERMLAQGLSFYDGHNENFSAIHLWHPQAVRDQKENELNKKYFQSTCCPVKEIVRNKGKDWGKMLDGSFSIIDGKIRNNTEHEKWIGDNVTDVPNYVENPIQERFFK